MSYGALILLRQCMITPPTIAMDRVADETFGIGDLGIELAATMHRLARPTS